MAKSRKTCRLSSAAAAGLLLVAAYHGNNRATVQAFAPPRPASLATTATSRTAPHVSSLISSAPPTAASSTAKTTSTQLQVAAMMGQGMDLFHIISAGSLAGAVGIGVAYPFDVIKTKQVLLNGAARQAVSNTQNANEEADSSPPVEQVIAVKDALTTYRGEQQQQQDSASMDMEQQQQQGYFNGTVGGGGGMGGMMGTAAAPMMMDATAAAPAATMALPSSIATATSQAVSAADPQQYSIWDIIVYIFKREGFDGFFGGVQSMMIGQAMIKALTFTVNALALQRLHTTGLSDQFSEAQVLFMAAACAGFLASFVVAPMERIACLMQADETRYDSEWDCLQAVIEREGVFGWLLQSGWLLSLGREMPSDMIYFGLYGLLMASPLVMGAHPVVPAAAAPLLFGAVAGMASWVPIYPVDVVKTLYQAQEDKSEQSALDISRGLYEQNGLRSFYEGMDSKLIRAAVHHAVTFAVFDAVLKAWAQ